MSTPTLRRHKFGIFFHPAVESVDNRAQELVSEILDSFVDPEEPDLGRTEVKDSVRLIHVDGRTVLAADHRPGSWSLIVDDEKGPVRAGLIEALDWWNGETLLVAPEAQALAWDTRALPNAWNRSWHHGLVVQTITQYPKRLGHRVLAEWNPGLRFLPFEFFYYPATDEQVKAALQRWFEQQSRRLKSKLETLPRSSGGSWYSAHVLRYREGIAPNPETLQHRGTREQAEQWAEEYRGLCFLVDAETGESHSRWAER